MSYYLGIDLGTTYTAAAVHEGSPRRGPEVVTLGERGPTMPSVLCLKPDGGFVAGDAAERHAITDPQRIARQFKRRLGDPTPLLIGGARVPAEVLTGRLLAWVVDSVVRARGGERPASIVLTHPANWGPYKRDLLDKAAEIAGLPGAVLVTEPQAAAISYAAQERVDEGAVVAVYDLGGGTFDAAVLRKEADGGFTVLGSPEGIERLGGIDVDAALFARVTSAVGDAYEGLDPDDPQAVAAVARLRTPAMVDHVLLVGGSSRIPLVAELVSSGLGRPVAVDAHPKHAVALGAAIVAARAAGALAPASRMPPPPTASPPPSAGPASAIAYASATGSTPPPPSRSAPPLSPSPAHAAAAPPGSPPPPSSSPSARPPGSPPPPSSPPAARPPAPVGGPPGAGGAYPSAAVAAPRQSSGYRSGSTPPAPGTSGDLPPGFLTGDAKSARRTSERRRKRVMLALGVLIAIGALVATAVITADANKKETLADMAVGECFTGDPNDVDVVGCDEPHQFELFAIAAAPDAGVAYPGADKVYEDGGSACLMMLVDYYGATGDVAVANGLQLDPIAPSEAQWNDGDTDTYCLARSAEADALDASIEGHGAG
jgi:hypothetical protein